MNWHIGLLVSLLVVCTSCLTDATNIRHMNNFIRAVEIIEAENPGLSMLYVVKGLRKAVGLETNIIKHYLGDLSDTRGLATNPSVISYISKIINHRISKLGEEEGVVLSSDGSNVALAPMLLGLEAGLQATIKGRFQGLYPLTLSENLVASFVHHANNEQTSAPLGTKGCWDSIKYPRVLNLSGLASLATDALIIGGMDGFILGTEVAKSNHQEVSLSTLLKSYYSHQLDSTGLDGAPHLISQNRRKIFKELVSFSLLRAQVARALTVRQRFNGESESKRLEAVLNKGFEKFVHMYAVCPNIIWRCQWGAAPYIGSPTYLWLPMPYLFIHHTYEPSTTCTSFEMCAADMRNMQSYHQNTNGWADIGYNFVAGGDGNMYEGRGWEWQGAHAAPYNADGYGVCYVGDYSNTLPSLATLEMVRYDFTQCAMDQGYLSTYYSLYGHRQAGGTDCPGNALYSEIQSWENYESYLP